MSTETTESPKAVAIEDLKAAWNRILPDVPSGLEMTLYFDGHYSNNPLGNDKTWEYVGAKWKVHLRDGGLKSAANYSSGDGETPDMALVSAISEMTSIRRRVDQKDVNEFKQWRAARDRAGLSKPYDKDGWNKAVTDSVPEGDD